MQLRIGSPVTGSGPRNLFKLVLVFLQGGAKPDTYRTIFIRPQEVQKFQDFIAFLLWCTGRHPGQDEIASRIESLEDKHNYRFSCIISSELPLSLYWHSVPALEQITYYDPVGVERHVEIFK